MQKQGLTYAAAGVDIDEAEKALCLMREAVQKTHTENVLAELGTFGAMYRIPNTEVIAVSSIDGVGTRIRIGIMANKPESNGAALVAHCVNDLLVMGCPAAYFLDYFGASKLNSQTVARTVTGAAEECERQRVSLIGGETAGMPGFYVGNMYDLVGSIHGFVHQDKLVTGQDIRPGDHIIGLGSNGLHTNGYSHASKTIFSLAKLKIKDTFPWGVTVGDELTKPHRCYAGSVLPLIQSNLVTGAAHITGGGLPDNLVRPLPEGCRAVLFPTRWEVLPIFTWIREHSGQPLDDWRRTYNLGIGLVLIVHPAHVNFVLRKLWNAGEKANIIGEIRQGERGVEFLD